MTKKELELFHNHFLLNEFLLIQISYMLSNQHNQEMDEMYKKLGDKMSDMLVEQQDLYLELMTEKEERNDQKRKN